MTLIFDIPKQPAKRKPTPKCEDFEANKTKVPTPKTTADECDDFETSISDAEKFEKTLLDETPQTPPKSPGISQQAKRKGRNTNNGNSKRSKRKSNRVINLSL